MSGCNRAIGINMSMGFCPAVVGLSMNDIEAFVFLAFRMAAREAP
jgi:hypothetical protein